MRKILLIIAVALLPCCNKYDYDLKTKCNMKRFTSEVGRLQPTRLFDMRPIRSLVFTPIIPGSYHDAAWGWLLTKLGIDQSTGPFPAYATLMTNAAALSDLTGYNTSLWTHPYSLYTAHSYELYKARRAASITFTTGAVPITVTHNRDIMSVIYSPSLRVVSTNEIYFEVARALYTTGAASYRLDAANHALTVLSFPFLRKLYAAYPTMYISNNLSFILTGQYDSVTIAGTSQWLNETYSNIDDALIIYKLKMDEVLHERYISPPPIDSTKYFAVGLTKSASSKSAGGLYGFSQLSFDIPFKLTKVGKVTTINPEDFLTKSWPVLCFGFDNHGVENQIYSTSIWVSQWFGRSITLDTYALKVVMSDFIEMIVTHHNLNESPVLRSNGYYFNTYYRAYVRNDIVVTPTLTTSDYGTVSLGFIRNPSYGDYGKQVNILSYAENATGADIKASLSFEPF